MKARCIILICFISILLITAATQRLNQKGLTGSSQLVSAGEPAVSSVTISTTFVQNDSFISITPTSEPVGTLYLYSVSAGVGFEVRSNDGTDTCTFDWELRN